MTQKKNKKEKRSMLRVLQNKKAMVAISTAVKVIISIVLGASMLIGTYAVLNGVVLPNARNKIGAFAAYDVDQDSLSGMGTGGVQFNAPSIASLEETYEFSYYSSMAKAIEDINNGTVENADAAQANAVAGTYTDENGKPVAVLLRDSVEESYLAPATNMSINLGGHTLGSNHVYVIACNEPTFEKLEIDGRLPGSCIHAESSSGHAQAIRLNNTGESTPEVVLTGCAIEAKPTTGQGAGVYATGCRVRMNNCSVSVESGSTASTYGIVGTASTIEVKNSVIKVLHKDANTGGWVLGIMSSGSNISITHSKLSVSHSGINTASGVLTAMYADNNSTYSFQDATVSIVYSGDSTSAQTVVGLYNYGASWEMEKSTLSLKYEGEAANSTTIIGVYQQNQSCQINRSKISVVSNAYNSSSSPTVFLEGVGNMRDATCEVKDSDIQVKTPSTLSSSSLVYGFANNGTANAENTTILADAVYGEALCYKTTGFAAGSSSNTTLKNCNITGIHSGVSSTGSLSVDGGTYQGVGHGGFYFGGKDKTHQVKNATIRQGNYYGYTSPDTDSINGAAFYVGGSGDTTGIQVYMDNCTLETTTKQNQIFVLRGTDGETNNSVYLSNTTVPDGYKIRIDNDTMKLYAGAGTNVTDDKVSLPSAVIHTSEDYSW